MGKKDDIVKKENAIKIGSKIQSLRESKGISRRGLAKNINISDTALANIENGKTSSISIDLGEKICNNLNISFSELFSIESFNVNEIKILKAEIERLKKENSKLEEQLQDKRTIIEFLSSNDFLIDVAAAIYSKENPEQIRKRDFNDLNGLIKEIEDRPFDPGNKESLINYIRPRLKKIQLK